MGPKKRDAENAFGQKPKAKKPRKKKDEFDSDSEPEQEQNNGTPADEDYEEHDSSYDVTLEGSMLNGEFLICGGTNWDMVGRHSTPKGVKTKGGPSLWRPHRVAGFTGVKVRSVISGCTSAHSVVITTDGKAHTFGRNEKGGLGHGDLVRVDKPSIVEPLSQFNIIEASCGRNHTLFLTDRGHVYSCGDNKFAQLGLGNQSSHVATPHRISYKGPPVRKVACGADFSMIADIRGNLYSFGCPEYGQLDETDINENADDPMIDAGEPKDDEGVSKTIKSENCCIYGHNTDGKYFVTSNKLAFKCELRPRKVNVWIEKSRDGRVTPVVDVDVREIACGVNHSVILDAKKRVFTWGFGGYGRLGHADNKDEMVPRQVKFFDGPNRMATMITAGSTFCMGLNEYGALYFWGQTKSSGEAAMYPKLVQDLTGWRVRSMGCGNKSIVVAADDSVVSWGPSPTYGELGYGENKPKSSTTPQEMKTLDGIYVHMVAMGHGHTLMIARCDADEERAKIEKLPLYTPV